MTSELGTAEDVSQIMSVAPSDSSNTSRESTRASTPVEPLDSDLSAQPSTPKAEDQIAAADDVPMMDPSPSKNQDSSSIIELPSLGRTPSPVSEGLDSDPGRRNDNNK